MSRLRVRPPANDREGDRDRRPKDERPEITLEALDAPPLCVAEVEIFDVLISSVEALTAANDNAPEKASSSTPAPRAGGADDSDQGRG